MAVISVSSLNIGYVNPKIEYLCHVHTTLLESKCPKHIEFNFENKSLDVVPINQVQPCVGRGAGNKYVLEVRRYQCSVV